MTTVGSYRINWTIAEITFAVDAGLMHERIAAVQAVLLERNRQDAKWGTVEETPHTPTDWISILTEELGEAARDANDMTFSGASSQPLEVELIQVAAVALAALEDLAIKRSRNGG